MLHRTWTFKSTAIITLSVLRTRAERNPENSDKNSEQGPVSLYTITNIIGMFMVGSDMLRMRVSNELNLCLGFCYINKAELKMTAIPPPLQWLWECVCKFDWEEWIH